MRHMLHHIVRYHLLPLWQARVEEHRIAMSHYRDRLKESIKITGYPHFYPSMIGIMSRRTPPRTSEVWSNGLQIRGVKPIAKLGQWEHISKSVRLFAKPLWNVAKPLHDACATLSKDAYPMAYFMNDESQQTSIWRTCLVSHDTVVRHTGDAFRDHHITECLRVAGFECKPSTGRPKIRPLDTNNTPWPRSASGKAVYLHVAKLLGYYYAAEHAHGHALVRHNAGVNAPLAHDVHHMWVVTLSRGIYCSMCFDMSCIIYCDMS